MPEFKTLPAVNHTPGPWTEGKTSDSIVTEACHCAAKGYPVEDEHDHHKYYGGCVVAESIAGFNRPLIIAAPELYSAALRFTLEWYRSCVCSETEICSWCELSASLTKAMGLPCAVEDKITVCTSCLEASCWQGIFKCQHAKVAKTFKKFRWELAALSCESPGYWKTDKELANE